MPYVYLFLIYFVQPLIQKIKEKDVIFYSTHKPVKLV